MDHPAAKILVFIGSIATSFFGAFVLMKMWLWFVVPFGVQEINMVWAFGLHMLTGFLTATLSYKREPEDSEIVLMLRIIYYTLCLVVGYILSLCM